MRLAIYKVLWYLGLLFPCVLVWVSPVAIDAWLSPWRTASFVALEALVVSFLVTTPWLERKLVDTNVTEWLGINLRSDERSALVFIRRNLLGALTLATYMALTLIAHIRFLTTQGLENGYAVWHMRDIIRTGGGVTAATGLPNVGDYLPSVEWLLAAFLLWGVLDVATTLVTAHLDTTRQRQLRGLVELISGTSWTRVA